MPIVFCNGTNKSDSDDINEECSIFNVKTFSWDSLRVCPRAFCFEHKKHKHTPILDSAVLLELNTTVSPAVFRYWYFASIRFAGFSVFWSVFTYCKYVLKYVRTVSTYINTYFVHGKVVPAKKKRGSGQDFHTKNYRPNFPLVSVLVIPRNTDRKHTDQKYRIDTTLKVFTLYSITT